jgi:ubiquitin carboxyl-terminal hydrolase MINDY-3/4
VIGQFGHCTQELMNLLLTGEASSNVFDGQIPMLEDGGAGADQLMLKGVRGRADVGYLSQLESLRYCEVSVLCGALC